MVFGYVCFIEVLSIKFVIEVLSIKFVLVYSTISYIGAFVFLFHLILASIHF